jgi:peptidyl-prolyl cis-trans isomerase B (cyclophilin B)
MPAPQKTNTLAIVGFVLAFFFSIVGSILGIIALDQIKKSNGVESGRGLAIAAIVIGILPVFIICLLSLLGPAIGSVFSNIISSI